MTDRILIIDFGSQVTQLIARRIREAGVYSEIVPYNRVEAILESFSPKGVILSGGPASVNDDEAPKAPGQVYELGVPVLGICYGQQLLCQQLGGVVEGSDQQEFGRAMVAVTGTCGLLD
ncbi:MAG: GMP synthase (glutamine-hydrolyzing), partial [Sphingomonadales bacterium]